MSDTLYKLSAVLPYQSRFSEASNTHELIKKRKLNAFGPINGVSFKYEDNNAIEFEVRAQKDSIDFQDSFFEMRLKAVSNAFTADATDLWEANGDHKMGTADDVAVDKLKKATLLDPSGIHALIKKITIYLNDKVVDTIEDYNRIYSALKVVSVDTGYLSTLSARDGSFDRKTVEDVQAIAGRDLQQRRYASDLKATANHAGVQALDVSANALERGQRGATKDMFEPLHAGMKLAFRLPIGLLNYDKYLPMDGMTIKIRLELEDPTKCLTLVTGVPTYTLDQCKFMASMVQYTEDYWSEYHAKLQKQGVPVFFDTFSLSSFRVNAGGAQTIEQTIRKNVKELKTILMSHRLDADQVQGRATFDLKGPNTITSVQLKIDNVMYPDNPIQVGENNYGQALQELLKAFRLHNMVDFGSGIRKRGWGKDQFIFGMDFEKSDLRSGLQVEDADISIIVTVSGPANGYQDTILHYEKKLNLASYADAVDVETIEA